MSPAAGAVPALQEQRKSVRDFIVKQQGQLEAALPAHVTADRMLRTFFTELSKTPTLYECTPVSLLGALIQAAQLGLEFGILGHAYLVPFRNRRRGTKEVQLVPGYKGLLKLARNSGELSTVAARVVHVGDTFRYHYGLEPRLEHIPASEPGVTRKAAAGVDLVWPITHFYAAARLRDGGHQFEVMSKQEVEAHRDRYAADKRPESAWATNFPEMGLKTVLRRLCRLLPASVELQRGLLLDAQVRHGEPQNLAALVEGATSGLDWVTEEGAGEDESMGPELAALRVAVLEAEAGLTGPDLAQVRRQHLQTVELEEVREPAVLQGYLDALPKVPRPPANPVDVTALLQDFARLSVPGEALAKLRGRPPARWTTTDLAELRALLEAGADAVRTAVNP